MNEDYEAAMCDRNKRKSAIITIYARHRRGTTRVPAPVVDRKTHKRQSNLPLVKTGKTSQQSVRRKLGRPVSLTE